MPNYLILVFILNLVICCFVRAHVSTSHFCGMPHKSFCILLRFTEIQQGRLLQRNVETCQLVPGFWGEDLASIAKHFLVTQMLSAVLFGKFCVVLLMMLFIRTLSSSVSSLSLLTLGVPEPVSASKGQEKRRSDYLFWVNMHRNRSIHAPSTLHKTWFCTLVERVKIVKTCPQGTAVYTGCLGTKAIGD